MKNKYISPEFDVVEFSFDEIMANINVSQIEDTHIEGGDIDF